MSPSPLEIKTSALTRLLKEEKLYQQELKDQESHIASMKAQNADPYELKKQVEVLDDTKRVIPELKKKISEMAQSLEDFLKTYDGAEDVTSAKEKLEEVKKFL
ncbi:CYFA0S02e10066g1_1 [Cyberlindnera fabianii]|uniref:Tubulin-specific chaperone A n=1 Tax=Cyberlindnera fabianii TaxID=36022 RepID=A0A061AUI0_CYBFA|nr:Tubulin-specific chaperone A [Cyberlindnera fabianii]CDR38986.1 CYFA0S02e10066g1_1 [Cyberlindnera fabianii]